MNVLKRNYLKKMSNPLENIFELMIFIFKLSGFTNILKAEDLKAMEMFLFLFQPTKNYIILVTM